MKITKSQLLRAVPKLYKIRLDEFVDSFNKYSDDFGINTPLRAVHYLAQVFHESGSLRYVEEIASGAAYDTGKLAVKLGNTPQRDGDGQKYKGRGFIQITGKANYKAYRDSGYCNGDVVAHPEWLCKSPGNQKASMWFWKTNGLNALADRDDILAITKKVNGGSNGLASRKYYYRRFKTVFGL